VKGWAHIKFKHPIFIRAFGLKSAPNNEERDPLEFELLAKVIEPSSYP